MFKLLTVIKPAPAQPKALNHFNFYTVEMPAGLMQVLQKRVYTVLLTKYYGIYIPHDLSNHHLAELDDFLLSRLTDEGHNLIIDAYELALLKRFLIAERIVVGSERKQLVPSLTNAEYWKLTGELLESTIRPTTLVGLSLFA